MSATSLFYENILENWENMTKNVYRKIFAEGKRLSKIKYKFLNIYKI
ncbi:hypothetical protein bcere0022_13400 [Bacillus cereus Rock3-44]|nr:hypothetical protein bcere0022_13400 [Bacillus cereus Rock3-44]